MENNYITQFSLFRNIDSSITINTNKYIQILIYSCSFVEAFRSSQGAAIYFNLCSNGNVIIRGNCFSFCYTTINDIGQTCSLHFSPTEYNELLFDNNCIYMCSPNNSITRRSTIYFEYGNNTLTLLNSSMVSVYRNSGFATISNINNLMGYCNFFNHTISDSMVIQCNYGSSYLSHSNFIGNKQINPEYGLFYSQHASIIRFDNCNIISNIPNGYLFLTDVGQIIIHSCHLPTSFSSSGSVTIQSTTEYLQPHSYSPLTLSYCLSIINFHHYSTISLFAHNPTSIHNDYSHSLVLIITFSILNILLSSY